MKLLLLLGRLGGGTPCVRVPVGVWGVLELLVTLRHLPPGEQVHFEPFRCRHVELHGGLRGGSQRRRPLGTSWGCIGVCALYEHLLTDLHTGGRPCVVVRCGREIELVCVVIQSVQGHRRDALPSPHECVDVRRLLSQTLDGRPPLQHASL